jgi:hypothetical protein
VDIRLRYARCSTLGQELDSQLDALSKHGIPRDKAFSEKISTRVRGRPKFEDALRTAREVKAHAPHCRVDMLHTMLRRRALGDSAGLQVGEVPGPRLALLTERHSDYRKLLVISP